MDELLRRWVDGWRLCRGLDPAIEDEEALEVVLRLPGRARELFALADRPDVVDRLATRAVGDSWLTVTTQRGDEVARRLTTAGLRPFAEQKKLMTIDLRDHPRPAMPTPYELEVSSRGPLEYVRISDTEGQVAAHGMAAVVGRDAVMHDIQTDPAHRRRGLGSVVMGALASLTLERGARTGLLMATTEGVHLYRTLGWLPEATIVTAA